MPVMTSPSTTAAKKAKAAKAAAARVKAAKAAAAANNRVIAKAKSVKKNAQRKSKA